MSNLFRTGIRPAVDHWLLAKSKEQRDYGDYWSASSAGYCQRKVIFERLGVPKIESDSDARKQRVFTSGHLFHDWLQSITKESGLSIAQELELQDEDLMIRGHIDDLVLIKETRPEVVKLEGQEGIWEHEEQHLILYDYKTVNSRAFMWAKKNDNKMSHYHRLQLGTYMYMLRNGFKDQPGLLRPVESPDYNGIFELSEARILKIEKDTLMMMEQQLMWSSELESDVLSYWSSLNDYWKAKKLPKCTCADVENGFMAREQYNGYFYEGKPCSLAWYKKWKKELKK